MNLESNKREEEREIANFKRELNSDHHETFNALRQGYRESIRPGAVEEVAGNRKFILYMNSIEELNNFFKHFEMTQDGCQFLINQELTIHPKAFIQILDADKNTILKATKDLHSNEISLKDFLNKYGKICKNYRLVLDKELIDRKTHLADKFKESMNNIEVGGNKIFAKLKPSQINRLYSVMKDCDPTYVELCKDFAAKVGAENLSEFCAATEYIYRQVTKEVVALRRKLRNPDCKPKKELQIQYKTEVINEFRKDQFNKIANAFQDLRNKCEQANNSIYPRFVNSFTAANHFDKHPLSRKDSRELVTCEEYFKIAEEIISSPKSMVLWTQDGSSLGCTYISEKFNAIARTFINSHANTVIASMMENHKGEKEIPERLFKMTSLSL